MLEAGRLAARDIDLERLAEHVGRDWYFISRRGGSKVIRGEKRRHSDKAFALAPRSRKPNADLELLLDKDPRLAGSQCRDLRADNHYHGGLRSTAMDPPIPALVTTREEALTLMDRIFETLDPGVFAAMVRATTDAEDTAVFGIVRARERNGPPQQGHVPAARARDSLLTRWPSSPGRKRSEPPRLPDSPRSLERSRR